MHSWREPPIFCKTHSAQGLLFSKLCCIEKAQKNAPVESGALFPEKIIQNLSYSSLILAKHSLQ